MKEFPESEIMEVNKTKRNAKRVMELLKNWHILDTLLCNMFLFT